MKPRPRKVGIPSSRTVTRYYLQDIFLLALLESTQAFEDLYQQVYEKGVELRWQGFDTGRAIATWAGVCNLSVPWIEGVASSTIQAWRQHPELRNRRMPYRGASDMVASGADREIKPFSFMMPPDSRVGFPSALFSLQGFRQAVHQEVDRAFDKYLEDVTESLRDLKAEPRDFWKKAECTALYLAGGLTQGEIGDLPKYARDQSRISE